MKWMDKMFGTQQAEKAALVNAVQMGRVYPAQQQVSVYDAANAIRGTALPQGALLGAGTAISPAFMNSQATPRSDPNTLPEMQLSLEDAHALWVAKFGTEWVTLTAVQDADNFNWFRVAERLQQAHLLEFTAPFDAYKIIPLSLWK